MIGKVMRPNRHKREQLKQRRQEALADNFATPKTSLKPIGTVSYLPNGRAMSTGYRKGPDTTALESNAHTSTFWLHHTGLQHSSPVGYLGTAILRGQKSTVELDKLSYASRNGLSDRDRKKRSKPTPLAKYTDGRTILDANESETVLVKDKRVPIWAPRKSELYHKESEVTLAPPPVPVSKTVSAPVRKVQQRKDMDAFDTAAEKAKVYLDTFGSKDKLLKPDELPCADG